MTQKTFDEMAIANRRRDHLYFTMVPNVLWFFDLTPAAFKLYNTIVKTTGCDGQTQCFKTTKTLAKETGLSMGSISKAKARLEGAGLIERYSKRRTKGGRPVDHLVLVDIWKENMLFFSEVYSPDEETPTFSSLSELRGRVFSRNEGVYSPGETEEEPFNKNQKGEEEKKDIEFFESLEHHPESAFQEENLEAIADPSKKSSAVEEIARQLAPAIDWVWGSSEASDKSLLHAAEELLKACGANVLGVLEGLDSYLDNPKNREWARNVATDPHWLIKSVAGQYQKLQGQAHRQSAARSGWAEAAERSQAALAERQAVQAKEKTEDELWWDGKLDELKGQMTLGAFNNWLRGTTLLEREDGRIVVGVANEHAKDWLENRLMSVVERTVAADGVTDVMFEVGKTSMMTGGDVRQLGGKQ